MFITFIQIIFIHILGLLSPGPDFTVVTRNSISSGRKVGVFTALGIGVGIIFHVSIALLGLNIYLQRHPDIFKFVSYGCALYLIYLGLCSLNTFKVENRSLNDKCKKRISLSQAFMQGLFTNLLNVKAFLYFISIFSAIVPDDFSILNKLILGVLIILITFLYFALIGTIFTSSKVHKIIQPALRYIDLTFGVLLIYFGIKLIFS